MPIRDGSSRVFDHVIESSRIGIPDLWKAKIREHWFIRIVDDEFMTKIQIRERHKEWPKVMSTVHKIQNFDLGWHKILPKFPLFIVNPIQFGETEM